MFTKKDIKDKLNAILSEETSNTFLTFENEDTDINEVAMRRVVRKGKIVKKVKQKKKGFKVLRTGNTVKFVRMTQKEKRLRRKSARKAWKVGKGSRINKSKRTMIRSKVRMRTLYGK